MAIPEQARFEWDPSKSDLRVPADLRPYQAALLVLDSARHIFFGDLLEYRRANGHTFLARAIQIRRHFVRANASNTLRRRHAAGLVLHIGFVRMLAWQQ
jgi:hypothetical protein